MEMQSPVPKMLRLSSRQASVPPWTGALTSSCLRLSTSRPSQTALEIMVLLVMRSTGEFIEQTELLNSR